MTNDDKSNSFWKKPRKGWRAALIWCVLLGILMFSAILIVVSGKLDPTVTQDCIAGVLVAVVVVLFCLFAIYVVIPLIRWLFWKHWRRTLLSFVCLVILVALFYAEEDWRGKYALDKFKRQWEAKGQKFDWQSMIPPPVPGDQNFAMVPIWVESMKAVLGPENSRDWYGNNFAENGRTNFVDRLDLNIHRKDDLYSSSRQSKTVVGNWQKGEVTDLKMWQTYYRTPTVINLPSRKAITTNEFPVAAQPRTPAQDVLFALSKYDSAIEELRQAGKLPYSRFPLNYATENPGMILLPHLGALKCCSQVLQLRASAEVQSGQNDRAVADIELLLKLTDSVRAEPFLITHLVRMDMANSALQSVYDGLASHKWSDEQLVELDLAFGKLDFLADYQLSMRGELAFQDAIVSYLRHHPEQYPGLVGESGNNQNTSKVNYIISAAMVLHVVPKGWLYQNQRLCAQSIEEFYLPGVDDQHHIVHLDLFRKADMAVSDARAHITPYNIQEALMLPGLNQASLRFVHSQSAVDMARVAIALERYRLAHDTFPDSLDVLALQHIVEPAHDIINGQPLQYHRYSDGGFVLYSVGWNEVDDGGDVALKDDGTVDINNGDWVWCYPGKSE